MPNSTPDTEYTLDYHDYSLTVSPYGASLRGMTHCGEAVITGYHGAAGKVAGQGDVLIPFPGRIRSGRYKFEGQTYQLECNDSEGPNAIHGFLRKQMWETSEHGTQHVSFNTGLLPDQHAGYPFSLSVKVTYSLSESGLSVATVIQNDGATAAPVAAGFHPYFTVGTPLIDECTLTLPFAQYLESKDMLPTGKVLQVETSPYDFRQPHSIGSVVFNTCFVAPMYDADGICRITLSSGETGRQVTVWLDRSFGYVVLYSGDPLPDTHRRRSLAIEPMTCASDAFNHDDWGLVVLEPGEELSATWGVLCQSG